MCGKEPIQLALSGLDSDSASQVTTHARFHHKDGIEVYINLTYPPGQVSEAQEILSTLLEMSKIIEQSCYTSVVAQPRGQFAEPILTNKGDYNDNIR